MIVEHKNKTYDEFDVPVDAPPAYDEINTASSSHAVSPRSANHFARSSFRRIRTSVDATVTHSGARTIQNPTQKLQRPSPAYSFDAAKREKLRVSTSVPLSAKTQQDVRETVRGLVRDVVQGSSRVRSSASAALGVIDSCAGACSSHSVSFARILQERTIEEHSPIYWAIVSRPPFDTAGPSKVDNREDDAFLISLLAHAAPLAPVALSDFRAACLVASSNVLFQRLRSVPGVVSLHGTDRMLLTSSSSTQASIDHSRTELEKMSLNQKAKELPGFNDITNVREGLTGPEGDSFSVGLHLKMFQRRMRVSGSLSIEFIARGRLWQLVFFVVPSPQVASSSSKTCPVPTTPPTKAVPPAALSAARARKLPPGTWALFLALLEGSTQCYAEARLVVSESSSVPDAQRDLPALPGHSRSATSPATSMPSAKSDYREPSQPHLPPRQSTSNLVQKASRLSFFSRWTMSEVKTRPSIILNLTSVGSSPLIALPSPFTISSTMSAFPDEFELSSNADKPKRRRPTRDEKRTARKAAAKERRAQEGRETKKERKENARLAETVMLYGFDEASGKSGKKEDGMSGAALMYDGSPYIVPDGTLRAVLEARLSMSSPESNDSDCVIC